MLHSLPALHHAALHPARRDTHWRMIMSTAASTSKRHKRKLSDAATKRMRASIPDLVSSMPKEPALGPGKAWTPRKVARVRGRVIEIGWEDAQPQRLLVTEAIWCRGLNNNTWGEVSGVDPVTNALVQVDSPHQVIRIGYEYSIAEDSDGELTVVCGK